MALCRVHCVPLQQWEEALAAYFDRSSESPSVAAGKVILTNYEEDVCM